MADRRAPFRRAGRVGPGLAAAAVAGFLVGSCGGADEGALTTGTRVTATRPVVTATRPDVTLPTVPTGVTTDETVETEPTTATEATTTTEAATTEAATTATEATPPPPPPTTTVTETVTTAPPPPPPTTTSAEATPTTTTVASEPTSDEDDATWAWIVLGAILLAAMGIGIVLWQRRRADIASWSTQLEELARRSLVAMDDVRRDGSVATGQIQALAAEARSLGTRAHDDASKTAAARLQAGLDALAGVLESDRALRLGSPPPSAEQLSYSTALIRRQVEQLQGVLRPPSGPPPV
jgi:hypothetical protein